MMDVEKLYAMLAEVQGQLGYQFNCDERITRETLAGLLTNLARYGYMACPCRLADGRRVVDADIICPCEYRESDVLEYGSCYCNLYVSAEFNNAGGGRISIPERRPDDKAGF